MTSKNDVTYVCKRRAWLNSPDDLHMFREYTMDVLAVCAIVIICKYLTTANSMHECKCACFVRCTCVYASTVIEYKCASAGTLFYCWHALWTAGANTGVNTAFFLNLISSHSLPLLCPMGVYVRSCACAFL
jgi:hypothetical protein